MHLPMQITFRHMEHSPALEAKIHELAKRLDRYSQEVMSCRVVVEAPHKHHRQGTLYSVRIEVAVPDEKLLATRDPAQDHAHEDVYVSIRDAFDAMRRQLEEYARKRRGEVKRRQPAKPGQPPA